MKAHNEKKAKILYDFLDQSKLFKGYGREEGSFADERAFRNRQRGA